MESIASLQVCYLVELVLMFLIHRWYFFVNENAGWILALTYFKLHKVMI